MSHLSRKSTCLGTTPGAALGSRVQNAFTFGPDPFLASGWACGVSVLVSLRDTRKAKKNGRAAVPAAMAGETPALRNF
jgi:hypothetical protein